MIHPWLFRQALRVVYTGMPIIRGEEYVPNVYKMLIFTPWYSWCFVELRRTTDWYQTMGAGIYLPHIITYQKRKQIFFIKLRVLSVLDVQTVFLRKSWKPLFKLKSFFFFIDLILLIYSVIHPGGLSICPALVTMFNYERY